MKTSCPNLEKCPFFHAFKLQGAANALTRIYCQGVYEDCQRYKLKQAGQPVPDKLMPYGGVWVDRE